MMTDVTSPNPLADITSLVIPAKEAAKKLGLPYTSLRDEVFAGRLRVVKRGRAWYFDPRDLVRWVERSKEVLA